jgi:hypothetical protein
MSDESIVRMTEEEKLYFRDQLREARAVALKDAEAFEPTIHALERTGRFLKGVTSAILTLASLKDTVKGLALRSPLAEEIPAEWPELHLKFDVLYELLRDARNSAMHDGALARHMTGHAIELSIILEHALMDDLKKVKHFMVRNPVCAEMWQPLSFIRQMMLANSFSHLPVAVKEGDRIVWRIVSDLELARYLQEGTIGADLRTRLAQPLRQAAESRKIELPEAQVWKTEDDVREIIKNWNGLPALVLSESEPSNALLGLITPFDVL